MRRPTESAQYLEFKSTLRWDITQQTKSHVPEDAVLKTVAAFCNSEHGGTLVIGVADDGNVFGLEDDYATFSKRGQRGDRDLLGQHLQNLVMNRLGHAAATLVEWQFHRIDGNDLCRVQVRPSGFPVYDATDREENFWWRYPIGTVRVSSDLERERIIAHRWRG